MTRLTLRLSVSTALLGMLPLLAACSAPADAITSRCSSGPLSGRECVVEVQQLDQPRSLKLENGNYRSARIDAVFTVQSGAVDVELSGRSGENRQVTVTPGSAQRVEVELTLNRPLPSDEDNYFRVTYTPREPSTGMRGEINYSWGR